MAFLFSHTLTTFSSLSHSLLHHHHRHLSSTTTSISYVLRKKQFQLLTLTTPSPPSLLPHHRHLSFTSISASGAGEHPNSDHPSPSLVKEVREAFKQLAETEVFLEPFISQFHSMFPSPSSPSPATIPYNPSPNSQNPDHQNVLLHESPNPTSSTFSSLDENLQHLKVTALSLKHRQESDHQRLSELFESKRTLCDEIEEIIKLPPPTREIMANHNRIDTVIAKLTRLNEMTVEISELSQELTDSRLTSLYDICINLYKIREDWPQHAELWIELNHGLRVFQAKELTGSQVHAEDTNIQLDFFQHRINNLFKIRKNKEE